MADAFATQKKRKSFFFLSKASEIQNGKYICDNQTFFSIHSSIIYRYMYIYIDIYPKKNSQEEKNY